MQASLLNSSTQSASTFSTDTVRYTSANGSCLQEETIDGCQCLQSTPKDNVVDLKDAGVLLAALKTTSFIGRCVAPRTKLVVWVSWCAARIAEAAGDPRRRWAAIRNTLHQTEPRIVRSSVENRRLSSDFATFFLDKIQRIKSTISQRLGRGYHDPLQSDVIHVGTVFSGIQPPTLNEILTVIRLMPAKSSPLDNIPRCWKHVRRRTLSSSPGSSLYRSTKAGSQTSTRPRRLHHCLRSKDWIRTHSATIVQFPTCIRSRRL